ncbi:hypothetical protein [Methanosarcina sp.]|uniref:hypothetical protein n=1 Tax=Methanosarcina sp. TaxID=2213 RepID=UPI002B5786FE|nr:hypothetical protein [Methanosarcina sp.]HOW14311.1 hypothetical protein [Methanosarcina sp.]
MEGSSGINLEKNISLLQVIGKKLDLSRKYMAGSRYWVKTAEGLRLPYDPNLMHQKERDAGGEKYFSTAKSL